MSRKTTSGADVSIASSTSAPFRHSPATTNSGKFSSSCRTPRRAAGSSSAINAFHLTCFIVWLGTQLAIRHAQDCDCTAFDAWRDLEQRIFSIEHTQTFARGIDAVAWRDRRGRIDADAVINNGDL